MGGQMMRVRDCDGEGVGGVRTGDRDAREQAGDHCVDLGFLGGAGAHDGFLDQARGIFPDGDSGAGSEHQGDAAGLAELERRLRVLVEEDFLDCRSLGAMFGDQGFELVGECREAFGKGRLGVGLDVAIGDVAEAIALGADQAPAGRAQAGIETEDDQPSFSSSSSAIS